MNNSILLQILKLKISFSISILISLIIFTFPPFSCDAHIGDVSTIFESTAGPYRIRVIVPPPVVIPNFIPVTVRVLNNDHVDLIQKVTTFPVYSDNKFENHPAPNTLYPVENDPGLYQGDIYLLLSGSYQIYVTILDDKGEWITNIPYDAIPKKRPEMSIWIIVLGLIMVLIYGILQIIVIRKYISEGELLPGVLPGKKELMKGKIAGIITMFLLIIITTHLYYEIKTTFKKDDYSRSFQFSSNLELKKNENEPPNLLFHITDPRWQKEFRRNPLVDGVNPISTYWTSPLIPDHGKIMHFIMIKNDKSSIAHLHPKRLESTLFETKLPPIPEGTYHLFADVLHENGFTDTITSEFRLPPMKQYEHFTPLDPDDSWFSEKIDSIETATDGEIVLPLYNENVIEIKFKPHRILKGNEVIFQLEVKDKKGQILTLEPYMGMSAHAIIINDKFKIYAHVHPVGTVSMNAQKLNDRNVKSTDYRPVKNEVIKTTSLPFIFPEEGIYWIWVQVKINSKLLTALFKVNVI